LTPRAVELDVKRIFDAIEYARELSKIPRGVLFTKLLTFSGDKGTITIELHRTITDAEKDRRSKLTIKERDAIVDKWEVLLNREFERFQISHDFGINAQYLIDGLKALKITKGDVKLYMRDGLSPIRISNDAGLAVIMPVAL